MERILYGYRPARQTHSASASLLRACAGRALRVRESGLLLLRDRPPLIWPLIFALLPLGVLACVWGITALFAALFLY